MDSAVTLTCSACGAPQSVAEAAVREGWFRCEYCATPAAAPRSRLAVLEGPASPIVLLEEPGRGHLVLPAGYLFSRSECVLALFLVVNLGFMLAGALQLNPTGHPARTWGPPLLAGLGLGVAFLAVRRHLSEQHVEVSPARFLAYRTFRGRTYAVRETPLAPGELQLEPTSTTDGWGRSVPLLGWRARGRSGSLRLRTPLESRWLTAVLGEAATRRAEAGFSCRGCGAPIAASVVERARGGAACDFCHAAVVLDPEEQPPLVLPRLDAAPVEPPAPDAAGDVRAWDLGAPPEGRRLFGILVCGSAGTLAAGFMGVMLFLVLPAALTDEDAPPAMVGYALTGALLFAALGVYALVPGVGAAVGRRRLSLERGSLEQSFVLGEWTPPPAVQRAVWWFLFRRLDLALPDPWQPQAAPPPAPPAVGEIVGRLPVTRLTEVTLTREDGRTEAVLRTPNRVLRTAWTLPPPQDAALQVDLVGTLARRLEALGRPVAWREG